MEKIKAALHIHDKTEVPGDGAVGNMQNPTSTESHGPTSTELWGSGNADTLHHHTHKSDTVAAAAAANSRRHENYSQPAPRQDDPFAAARQAQRNEPSPGFGRGDETAIVAAELEHGSALPQAEKNLSPIDDPKLVRSIDPFRNEPEPSAETGPGSHFRPSTVTSGGAAPPGHEEAELVSEGHTVFYDKVTGREGHEMGKQ